MNLVLLFEQDYIEENTVSLYDHRFTYMTEIHKVKVNDSLTVGLLNGGIGKGTVRQLTKERVVLQVDLNQHAPAALPLTLVLALPRPKVFKRILQSCASMGVKDIIFIHSYRVEKSYWQSPLLQQEAICQQLMLGLEQAKDTILPTVRFAKRFKPFVEDHLPQLCQNTHVLVAHPNSSTPCPSALSTNTTLVIGPEGGFIAYEIKQLAAAGCRAVHIGERILKVETAIPVILSKLFF